MKKTKAQQLLKQSFWLLGLFMFAVLYSCSKDDDDNGELIASFSYDIDADNHLKVVFTNFSANATAYLWDFGDGETSTQENPTHIFPESKTYEVSLTASDADGESVTYKQNVQVTDPDVALAMLAGEVSKTWKLYRVGTSMGVGPDAEDAGIWWSLNNDGSRPCKYFHEFTFSRDGSFVFEDHGKFWGEEAVFGGSELVGTCFEATASNMVNSDGADVSAWLGGETHAFEYESSANRITLLGMGAWMGMPQLGTSGESIVPEASKSFDAVIEEHDGYDLMIVSYAYADLYWDFTYASYSDTSLEPEVITEVEDTEDLPKYTPEEFFNTFASEDEEDVQYLIPTESDVTITSGVDDPADPDGVKVGEYHRGTGQFADLKFQMDFNIQFDNFTTVSLDVYVPGTNNYDGGLNKSIMIWIADAHTTGSFWESWVQFLVPDDEVVTDQWVTYTFNLDEPSDGSTGTPLSREDLDLVGLTIGGGDHNEDAVFYIRNFIFE